MTARPDPHELWLAEQERISAQRLAAMREEAERMIAESRKSIQPRLRQVLDDCQRDYDEEREYGWAHPLDCNGGE
jgi:hypothetical protein